jgi:hypothetical protein
MTHAPSSPDPMPTSSTRHVAVSMTNMANRLRLVALNRALRSSREVQRRRKCLETGMTELVHAINEVRR